MDDFDSLARQALNPPQTPPAGNDDQFDELAKQVAAMGRATAGQTAVTSSQGNPDAVAKSLQASRATGIPQPAAEQNLDAAVAAAREQRTSQILFTNPKLQEFMGANPLAARMAQDDFDQLDVVDKAWRSVSDGARNAVLQNRMGRLGTVKETAELLLGKSSPETDAQIQAIEQQLAKTPQMRGAMGLLHSMAGFVTGLVDNALHGGHDSEQGGALNVMAGAGIGAAGGAAFAGVGAVPGAIAGAGVGLSEGLFVDAARVAAGNTYLRLSRIRGEDGQPISDAGKLFGSVAAAAANYALFKWQGTAEKALLGETAEVIAARAVEQAVTRPTYGAVFRKLAQNTGVSAVRGGASMGLLEGANVLAEEMAKAISPGKFATDPEEIIKRIADATVDGAILFGALHAATGTARLYGDLSNARRAEQQVEMMRNLLDSSAESKLRDRDLETYRDWMRKQMNGEPGDKLFLPAEKALELYQGARISPLAERAADPIFGWVADMPTQLREAAATRGDVVINTADFIAHLAGSPIAERLLPDLRVGADSMSLNEAKAFAKEYERQAKEAMKQYAAGDAGSPERLIYDQIYRQAIAAGRPEAEASRFATIATARAMTRAARSGIDPLQAASENVIRSARGPNARDMRQKKPGASFGGAYLNDDVARAREEFMTSFGMDHGTSLSRDYEFVPIKKLRSTEETDATRVEALMKAMREESPFDSKIPPVVVDSEGNILDGHHRVEAARRLGLQDVPAFEKFDVAKGRTFEQSAKGATSTTDKTGQKWNVKTTTEALGAAGDTLSHMVKVTDEKGQLVAYADFAPTGDGRIAAEAVHVAPYLQGRGIAEMMYRNAAETVGAEIVPGRAQTPAGAAMVQALQAKGVMGGRELFQSPAALPSWSMESVKGKITDAIKKAAIALAPKASLAERNYEKLDAVFEKVPNPLASEAAWREFMLHLVADNSVLGVPYNALKYARSPEAVAQYLSRLRPDQLESRRAGFALGAKIRAKYASGEATPVTTGRLLLWAMLSRKAGAYPHEAAYMDLVNGGVDKWIQKAVDGEWSATDADAYVKWSSDFMASKKGGASPGAGVTSNANDFGRILLTKLSEKGDDGTTALARLHALIADQNTPTDAVRRAFFALGDSIGIQNKVLSFAMLVTGRWDTLVLDRVQFTHLWGDKYRERAGMRNIYDGEGGGLAPAGEGHFGLAVYEALARGMTQSVKNGYRLAGFHQDGDGTLGAFHWDSWLIESSQAIGNPTIEALDTARPRADLAVRQGKFDTYAHNFEYRADGQYQIPMLDGSGYRILTPAESAEFQSKIKDPKEGVVPDGFQVSKHKERPWIDAPEVDRARYDAILSGLGRRADAEDVAPAQPADGAGRGGAGRAADVQGSAGPDVARFEGEGGRFDVNEPDKLSGDWALPDASGKIPGRPAGQGAAAAKRNVRPARVLSVAQSPDVPGTYLVTTQLVAAGSRDLPIKKVSTADDAAVAFSYLGRYAVEHLDGLVTDKNGKPLAIVGSFKGAIDQAAVYPATLANELSRVEGAHTLWVSHNHPSGNPALSPADLRLSAQIGELAESMGIKWGGLMATTTTEQGGVKYSLAEPKTGTATSVHAKQIEVPEGVAHSVPIVERTIVNNWESARIQGPEDAKQILPEMAGNQPSLFLLSAQQRVVGIIPLKPEDLLQLKGDRLRTIYQAVSQANGARAMLAMPDNKVSLAQARNLSKALGQIDVHVLDGVTYDSANPQATAKTLAELKIDLPTRGEFHQEARGSIRFEDGQRIISLFRDADHSTLIHESSHAWLEELFADAARPDAPQQLRDDAATVLKWLGVDSYDAIDVKHHEQFARAGEAYLMEGKAPSRGLAQVFSRFKQWLTQIYRSVSALDTPINNDIRQVFDRLLATDEEIADAQKTAGLEPLFRTKEDAGMTSAEWQAYLGKIESARQAAEGQLLDKTMARIRRQRTAEWKAEAAPIREEVAKQVDAQPDMQAFNLVTRGVRPDGTEGEPMRLDREVVRRMLGADQDFADLPRGVLSAKDGVHPDAIAELTGHASGDAVLRDLMDLEQKQREIRATEGEKRTVRQYLIDQGVESRMGEKDTLDEGSIREEAMAAINGAKMQELQALELRYLNRAGVTGLLEKGKARKAVQTERKKADIDVAEARLMGEMDVGREREQQRLYAEAVRNGQAITSETLDKLRAQADEILSAKTVDDLTSTAWKWSRDQQRAGREVLEAIRKKDPIAAAAAKQRQLLAGILYERAREAQEYIRKSTNMMDGLAGKAKFDGVDQAFTNQIHALLGRFGFDIKRDPGELERALGDQTLTDFVQEQYDRGYEIPVSPMVASSGADVGSLRLPDFRDLVDTVTSLRNAGRDAQTVRVMGETFDRQEAIAEMTGALAQLKQREKGAFLYPEDRGGLHAKAQKVASAMRAMHASLLKKENVFDFADGGDIDGPFNRFVFRPMKEAAFHEMEMKTAAVESWRALQASMPKGWSKHLDDTISADLIDPQTGQPFKMTRKRLLSMALNWGTEDNATKLADGYGWTQEAVQATLDRHMTEADWRFVQGVWAMFDRYREPIDNLQRRVTGVGIEFVEGRNIRTPFGGIEGKYFPLVYDASKSVVAEKNLERSRDALFENQYQRATTRNGSVISRVTGVKQPVDLSLDVIPWKIGQTIHDLAFREALMQADRLLGDRRVMEGLDNTFGPEVRRTMRPWLQHIANVANTYDVANGWVDNMLNTARTNATMVGIGFRVSTMFKHGFSALAQSFAELGPKYMLQGIREAYGTPGQIRRNWDFAIENSNELKYRMEQYDRDIKQNVDDWVKNGIAHKINAKAQEYGHMGVAALDFGSAVPTWIGAYRKAIDEGMEHSDAVYAADKVVRNAHGAQSIVDRAAIQESKGQLIRMVTMFYGFLNHMYNQGVVKPARMTAEGIDQMRAGEHGKAIRNFTAVAARTTGYLVVPALVNAMVTEGLPSDDKDEPWWAWAGKAILHEGASTVPILRDIAGSVITGHDYEVSPMTRAVKSVIGTAHDIASAVGLREKEPSTKALQHALESFGYLFGSPTGQLGATLQFLWDYNDGKVDPQTISDWYNGLLKGHLPKEH